MAVKIVEVYSVSPSPGAAAEQLLPLLYFDIIFLQSRPAETLTFYAFECSQLHFFQTIVVKLKHSLSAALKHFLPLAGKIIFPLTSDGVPVSLYSAGDSVDLTIAVSDADFDDVAGSHSKPADEFHYFVPQLPPAVYSDDEIKLSSVAIQVTLFPNRGICFGFTHHHAICDANSLFGFLHVWASIHRSNGDEHLGEDLRLRPFYGRSCVQDAEKLALIGWNQMKSSRPTVSLIVPLPLHKVRATFTLNNPQIEKLTELVMIKKPAMAVPSTFAVACGYLWSCLAKSAGDDIVDHEPEYFATPVNCRARLNPPLPQTYFGNCLVFSWADSTHGRLKAKDGFVGAVEAIAAAIRRTVDKGVLDNFENEAQRDTELMGKRVVSIVGSLRIDHYGADYGWGRAIKYECIHIDFDGGVNICEARDGGVEFGLSMPKVEMDAFADVFKTNLYINSNL